MNLKNDEIKPCHICNKLPRGREGRLIREPYSNYILKCEDDKHTVLVVEDTKEEAIIVWNRSPKSTEPTMQPLNEEADCIGFCEECTKVFSYGELKDDGKWGHNCKAKNYKRCESYIKKYCSHFQAPEQKQEIDYWKQEKGVQIIIENEIEWLNKNVFSNREKDQLKIQTIHVLKCYIAKAICSKFHAPCTKSPNQEDLMELLKKWNITDTLGFRHKLATAIMDKFHAPVRVPSVERIAKSLWDYEKGGKDDWKTEASKNEKKVYLHKAQAIVDDLSKQG